MHEFNPHSLTIVPLDKLILPDELNGSSGTNRSLKHPAIPAVNDIEAINCWLVRAKSSSHTQESYKREAERLFLWALYQQGKPLSSLTMLDLAEFRQFLLDPKPKELWIGPRKRKGNNDWKPFSEPLSPRSAKHADTVLSGLFRFLAANDYVLHNPYLALPPFKDAHKNGSIGVDRSLSVSQWGLLTDFLSRKVSLSEGSAQHLKWLRTEMMVLFLYATGLRIHELAKAKVSDIAYIDRNNNPQYWLNVIGKGNKLRQVPIPGKIYQRINDTHKKLTGAGLAHASEVTPLVPPLRKAKPKPNTNTDDLKPLAIHKILKELFTLAANDIMDTDPGAAKKLMKASTHWLRHTHGTHAVINNIPLTSVRDNLGHSNIATTSQYVHSDNDDRFNAFDKMGS